MLFNVVIEVSMGFLNVMDKFGMIYLKVYLWFVSMFNSFWNVFLERYDYGFLWLVDYEKDGFFIGSFRF